MKPATIIGLVLIVIGITGFTVGSFSYSHEKKDVDLGPLQIEHKQTSTVHIPPFLSGLALGGGIALVIAGAKTR